MLEAIIQRPASDRLPGPGKDRALQRGECGKRGTGTGFSAMPSTPSPILYYNTFVNGRHSLDTQPGT